MGKAAASSPDYGAEPVRRKGVFARLFRKKPAPATDAFGGGAEAAADDDPFGISDAARDARLARVRRVIGVVVILALAGAGGLGYVLSLGGVPAWLPFVGNSRPAAAVHSLPSQGGAEKLSQALIRPPGGASAPAGNGAVPMPEAPATPAAVPKPRPAPRPVEVAVHEPALPTPARRADGGPARPPAYADLPRPKPEDLAAAALPKAPIADLTRRDPAGLVLPAAAPDGRKPWRVYARPFTPRPQNARIAVLVTGLGLKADATAAAIEALPPDITLAFSPFAPDLKADLARARAAGHETLVQVPMESRAFPAVDPGPGGLLSSLTANENQGRLARILCRGDGYVGILATGGDRIGASSSLFTMLMRELAGMGLAMVAADPHAFPFAATGEIIPHAAADVTVGGDIFRGQVAARLDAAEETARLRGSALLLVEAEPLSLVQLHAWLAALAGKPYQIAPVSALLSE